MKTRRRSEKSNRFQRGGRGGKREERPLRTGKPPAPRPELLVAQVAETGAFLRGKVLHRDLVNLEFSLLVPAGMEVQTGDFVEARPVGGRGQQLEVLRKLPASGVASWAAICNHALRTEWPEMAEKEALALPVYRWDAAEGRQDWRKLAIVTIDGEDARDFDDAVWAEEWENGGHHIVVAIADVAHYIKENSALDDEARARGNSTYFPDRVLPMLPERLSNDLCSLRPHEERPVLGVEMWVDGEGELKKYAFSRGCIVSAARLTYTQVQAVLEGKSGVASGFFGVATGGQAGGRRDANGTPEERLGALGRAFKTLNAARLKRGALDLDLPEVKLEMNGDGTVKQVGVRPRLDAHRLIEELMILANVAAATELSKKGGGLYRIHPEPSKEKLENLRAVMGPLGFTTPTPNSGPKAWAKLVAQINGHPAAQTLLRAVLQSQQQAKYDADNIGHYGLALPLYAHFTSPIRRYADLVVHRALLKAMGLTKKARGTDEAEAAQADYLKRVADGINVTERKSQMAEWEARDRLVAQHFAGLVGKTFPAVVVGVQPFGCFVAVEGVAEGLLPKWLLGDAWAFVGSMNCFRKVRGGKGVLRVGARLEVELREADALGGRLTFGLVKD